MSFFDELKKNPEIKNHPLFKNAEYRIQRSRRISQTMSKEDLMDSFSQSGPKGKNDVIHEAVIEVEAAIRQFDWPVAPTVRFVAMKKANYSVSDPSKVVKAQLDFVCDFITKTGTTLQLDVPVTVNRGEVIPPSTFYFQGRQYVFGQKAIDSIVQRHTSYAQQPMRRMFQPIFGAEEQREAAIDRYERGYEARENDGLYGQRGEVKDRRWAKKKAQFDSLTKEVFNLILEDEDKHLTALHYLYTFDNTAELAMFLQQNCGQDLDVHVDWQEIASMLQERYSKQIKQAKKAQFEDMEEDEAFSFLNKQVKQLGKEFLPGFEDVEDRGEILDEIAEFLESDEADRRFSRKARQHKKPAVYEQVVKLMEAAKELGTDSFPRMYEHIEREYILDVINTASRDQWEMHLINDGWAINPKDRRYRKRGRVSSHCNRK